MGAACTSSWGRVGSSWSTVEPPTSENGILHVSTGVCVVWAVTKDRKVRQSLGLGLRAQFNVDSHVGFCPCECGLNSLGLP